MVKAVSDRCAVKESFVQLDELYNFAVESFCVSLKIKNFPIENVWDKNLKSIFEL